MQPTIKRSKQRDAILSFLMTRKDHPTADDVYMNVKKDFPNISLGTVYRNLSFLSERGEIVKLSYEGGADHYDANIEPHYHFVCTKCGRIIDVPCETIEAEVKRVAHGKVPGEIEQSVVYFKGVCEHCC